MVEADRAGGHRLTLHARRVFFRVVTIASVLGTLVVAALIGAPAAFAWSFVQSPDRLSLEVVRESADSSSAVTVQVNCGYKLGLPLTDGGSVQTFVNPSNYLHQSRVSLPAGSYLPVVMPVEVGPFAVSVRLQASPYTVQAERYFIGRGSAEWSVPLGVSVVGTPTVTVSNPSVGGLSDGALDVLEIAMGLIVAAAWFTIGVHVRRSL